METSEPKTKLLSPGGGSSAKNIRMTANFRTGERTAVYQWIVVLYVLVVLTYS